MASKKKNFLSLNYSKGETVFRVDFVIVGIHVTSASRDAGTSEASWQRKELMLGQAGTRELEKCEPGYLWLSLQRCLAFRLFLLQLASLYSDVAMGA